MVGVIFDQSYFCVPAYLCILVVLSVLYTRRVTMMCMQVESIRD